MSISTDISSSSGVFFFHKPQHFILDVSPTVAQGLGLRVISRPTDMLHKKSPIYADLQMSPINANGKVNEHSPSF